MKCEVIKKCNITVDKGSVVEISEEQYERIKGYCRPIYEKPVVKAIKQKVEDVK